MKCEYCDSMIRHVPDNGICPNCGGVLPEKENCSKEVDISFYFHKYQPNRAEAIKALRADTGMGLVEAKKRIDQCFDQQFGVSHQSDLERAKDNLLSAIREMRQKKK